MAGPQSISTMRAATQILLILVLPFVAYLILDIVVSSLQVKPAYVTDLQTYRRWRDPTHADLVVVDSQPYLRVFGRGSGLVPSGPSLYIFDRHGTLVDFSSDSGDARKTFVDRWMTPATQPISPDDIRSWGN